MNLSSLVKSSRGGVFNICALQPGTNKIAATGSGFWAGGHLITNHHVMNVPSTFDIWIRQEGDVSPNDSGLRLTYKDWLSRIVTSSDEHSYDYAIMNCPELAAVATHDFVLKNPESLPVGSHIAFLGYPLEHMNLTCHGGYISSFYEKKSAQIIQVDGSVNSGNSGGPLIEVESGSVIGIISRKATGLSKTFDHLRAALKQNVKVLSANGGIFMNGMDAFAVMAGSYESVLSMTNEIERQANVGIGYAFSAKHLLDEDIFRLRGAGDG